MFTIALTQQGLLQPATLRAWSAQQRHAIHHAIASGLQQGSETVVRGVREVMQHTFVVRQSRFLSSLRARLYDQRTDKLPALWIGSRVAWLGMHVHGGRINGKLLIPLTPEGQRMGRRAFSRVVNTLMQSGNAFFIRHHDHTLLMAENLRENARVLSRFKRAQRLRTGVTKIARGAEIPIAVLVSGVTLPRRFDFVNAVRTQLPALARVLDQKLKSLTP